jgi:hypothetical protein
VELFKRRSNSFCHQPFRQATYSSDHRFILQLSAQLICPISFHDPNNNVWSLLQPSIFERLPLRDISWKSTGAISLSQGHVEKLPLRFMPSTASLFKDTDHPFRWFLAPYGNIYFVSADTLEAYKDAKPAIKKWVETVVGLKRYGVKEFPLCRHIILQLLLLLSDE